MMTTYKAILRGDRLEWEDEAPESIAPEQAVPVHVTILEEADVHSARSAGREMAGALKDLAAAGGLGGIEDPLEWERQVRRDRDLPEREG